MTDCKSKLTVVQIKSGKDRAKGMIPKRGKPEKMGIRIVNPDDLLRKMALLRTKVSPAP
jgi:hypothetical protein